jgi:hypothetical protein
VSVFQHWGEDGTAQECVRLGLIHPEVCMRTGLGQLCFR